MSEKASLALQKYNTLVRLNPDDPEAHFGLGMAHEELDQMADAFREYQTVIRLDASHARAHMHLGFLYAKGGETAPAIKEWERAYELDPKIYKYFDDPSVKAFYGKRIQICLTVFEKPTVLRPDDAWGYFQLALTNKFFNRKEIALSHLKKAMDLNTNLWEAYNSAGEIYAEIGQYHFAKIHFQKAIDVNPKYTETYYNLGSILEEEGMVGQAIMKYERGLETSPSDSKLLLALGRAYIKQGQFKKAIAKLQKSLDHDKNDPLAHFLLAKACESIYRPDFAIKEYEMAIKSNPRYGEAHYNLGVLHLQMGDPKKAILHLEESLKLNPADSYAHYNLGNAYEKVEDHEKAINHYYNAVSLNPRDAFARYNLGQIYLKMERYEEAIRELRKTIEINPNDANIYFKLGKAYLEIYDFENAAEMLHKTVEMRPNDFDAQYALAQVFIAEDKNDIAVVQLKKVIDLKPDASEPHYEMGKCLYRVEAVDQAFDEFQKAVKLDPGHTKAKYGIGLVYAYHRNKPDIAIDFFNQILEEDPDFLPAIIEKGYSYLNLKKYEEAKVQFTKALNHNPDDVDILIGMGEVNTESGNYNEAEKIFQKVIVLDPENPQGRGKFAKLMAMSGRRNEAIEQYEKSISLDPMGSDDFYYELADLFFLQGNVGEAKATIANLCEMKPDNERARAIMSAVDAIPNANLAGTTIREIMGETEEEVTPEILEPGAKDIPREVRAAQEAEGGFLKPKERLVRKKSLAGKKGLKSKLSEMHDVSEEDTETEQAEIETPDAPAIKPAMLNYFTKAVTAQAQGRDEDAMKIFQAIIENAPEYYQTYDNMSQLIEKRGNRDKAVSLIENGLEKARKYRDVEYIDIFTKRLAELKSGTGEAGRIIRSGLSEASPTRLSKPLPTRPLSPEVLPPSPPQHPVRSAATSILRAPEFAWGNPRSQKASIKASEQKPRVSSQEQAPATRFFSGGAPEMPVPQVQAPAQDSGEISIPSGEITGAQLEERLELIKDFMDLKKFDKAKTHLERLVSVIGDNPQVHRYLAEIYKGESNWADFIVHWGKFLEYGGPRNRENLFIMMEGLEKIGDTGRILSLLVELSDNNPDDTDLLEKIIALLLKDEKFEEAIPHLQNLTKKKPDDPRYIFHLARAYRNIGKYSLATVQYQKVLQLTEATEIYNELGYTYEKIDKIHSAIKAYAKSLTLEPDNITANLSLILLYEKNGDLQKAVDSIEHTVNIQSLTEDRIKILRKKQSEIIKRLEEISAAPRDETSALSADSLPGSARLALEQQGSGEEISSGMASMAKEEEGTIHLDAYSGAASIPDEDPLDDLPSFDDVIVEDETPFIMKREETRILNEGAFLDQMSGENQPPKPGGLFGNRVKRSD